MPCKKCRKSYPGFVIRNGWLDRMLPAIRQRRQDQNDPAARVTLTFTQFLLQRGQFLINRGLRFQGRNFLGQGLAATKVI